MNESTKAPQFSLDTAVLNEKLKDADFGEQEIHVIQILISQSWRTAASAAGDERRAAFDEAIEICAEIAREAAMHAAGCRSQEVFELGIIEGYEAQSNALREAQKRIEATRDATPTEGLVATHDMQIRCSDPLCDCHKFAIRDATPTEGE